MVTLAAPLIFPESMVEQKHHPIQAQVASLVVKLTKEDKVQVVVPPPLPREEQVMGVLDPVPAKTPAKLMEMVKSPVCSVVVVAEDSSLMLLVEVAVEP